MYMNTEVVMVVMLTSPRMCESVVCPVSCFVIRHAQVRVSCRCRVDSCTFPTGHYCQHVVHSIHRMRGAIVSPRSA